MRNVLCGFMCLFLLAAPGFAEQPVLKKGDRLAIVGDSITEQKLYSKFIETYLQACYPQLEVQCFQYGWGGERAPGFASRMENDLIPWHPTVVTTCYGMNDGSYRAYDDNIGAAYAEGMKQIVNRMKTAGATVVVGSPGVVDSQTWNRGNPDFDQVYNDNLRHLGQIAADLARENQLPHADVFGTMMKSMVAAKAKLGDEYAVAGGDGVHPGANGHLIMAYAFLRAMGLDGAIGTISLDLADGQAQATEGHRVIESKDGAVQIESVRYPFCFTGDDKDANQTASILPFLPFNQDLNRLILKVSHLKTPSAEVTFGTETRTFTADQLTSGINLAAEFQHNPFSEPFQRVLNEVGHKQNYETFMIKNMLTNFRSFGDSLNSDSELRAAVDVIRRKMTAVNDEAHSKVKATVQPVTWNLTVKGVQ
ncbi:MAG: SGNH/GDSL hydrolase family protein [Planctomycetaceae bacterium]